MNRFAIILAALVALVSAPLAHAQAVQVSPSPIISEGANVAAIRNGANAQLLNVYNTWTDAGNYERARVGYVSNVFYVKTEKSGTGLNTALQFGVNGTDIFQVGTLGHLAWNTDNSFDIGTSGANRPRSLFLGSNVSLGAAGSVSWFGKGWFEQPSDGVFTMWNAAKTDFGRLQFGGTTSAFPALKRVTTALQARLADDTGYAPFLAGTITANGSVIATGLVQPSTDYTVAGLPTCNAGAKGSRAHVTDASAPTFLGTLTGGGAVVAPVFCNGTAWVAG